jgi:hypothetical protein
MLPSYFWDDLLQYIEAREVVPIVGQGLLSVNYGGKPVLLQQVVSEKLAEAYGIPLGELPAQLTLNDTVCRIMERRSSDRSISSGSIYPRIKSIVEQLQIEAPECLVKLAQIRPLNLFITTTFDQMLEKTLNEVRYAGAAKTLVIPYAPNSVQDLPVQGWSERSTVFHLMGMISPSPSFAVTDEDYLEFVCALQAESTRPNRLFDVLKTKHLLILGSNFPDWLARFFIRMTKSMKLSLHRDSNEYYVDNQTRGDANLVQFLSHFSENTEIFVEGGPCEFIERLHAKWQERNPPLAAGQPSDSGGPAEQAEMPRGAIFISYASEDLQAARRLKETLEARGFDIWFDKDRLGAGEVWSRKIEKCVRSCSLFLPLISQNTVSIPEGYFRREWDYSVDRFHSRDQALPFILPVVIDDTPCYCDGVPAEFQHFQWTRLPEGQPSDAFSDQLRDLFRAAQKSARGPS